MMRAELFRDRLDAGSKLAERLRFLEPESPVVMGLPRGGVVVAFEVGRALRAPLDVVVVRKLGAPGQPELALGAIGEGGVGFLNEGLVGKLPIDSNEWKAILDKENEELTRRVGLFRGGRPGLPVAGRSVILVDDGLATGATAIAAARVLRGRGPKRLILAAPVGATAAVEATRQEVDDVICLQTPEWFFAVGQCYEDFAQTTDEEVSALLAEAAEWFPPIDRELEVEACRGAGPPSR
jgi:putative phosphoribosyl transferase